MNTLNMTQENPIIDKLIWTLTVAYLTVINVAKMIGSGKFVLLFIAFSILLLTAYQNNGHIFVKAEPFHVFVAQFGLFVLASALWATQASAPITCGLTIFEILITTSIFYSYYRWQASIDKLLKAIMWSGYIVAVYSICFYGMDFIINSLVNEYRLGTEFINVNELGRVCSMSIVINMYYWLLERTSLLSFVFSIPAIIVVAGCQSRTSLVVLIGGISVVIGFKYWRRNNLSSIISIILIAVVGIILIRALMSLPIFSGINDRMHGLISLFTGKGKVDSSAYIRQEMIRWGLEQFKKTPIFGIGIRNTGLITMQKIQKNTYLHNNYVELLAGGGLIGFISYYSICVYCIWEIFRVGGLKDNQSKIVIALIGILLVADYGSVSFYDKTRYFYYMIFFLHILNLKRHVKLSEKTG